MSNDKLAEVLRELKTIADSLPALATKVDVVIRLRRAERMAATINKIIQAHAAEAAQTRDTMTPRELAKRIGRGENWKMVDEPAQAQAQSGECQRNSPAGCDCIDTCVAISQPQAAEPVAITKDSDDLYTGWLSWTGKELPPGTKLYTHPQPAKDAKDAARLDWLEAHPRLASIVIDGSATDCYLYGISGAPGLKLREILDAAMAKESGR